MKNRTITTIDGRFAVLEINDGFVTFFVGYYTMVPLSGGGWARVANSKEEWYHEWDMRARKI